MIYNDDSKKKKLALKNSKSLPESSGPQPKLGWNP